MNKRGIEGMPLKYMVLMIAMALIIALIVSTYTSLGSDIRNATSTIGEYVRNLTSNLTK
ncbi:MAG: hypothetical protein QXX71_01270 [Candidatus Nanoarchaeia archaeon]|nr:hypothetical protein [Candidatus Haiyanarchaeum thermophilum]MCW1302937.1 hypothetical protein [Candidatus Haiyanarchaeum thermophilum]MCW1303614.1 hypothetical protein [Candidatus Haiyanarchaeum thermophilum]MCW1306296.1 hypothetical protein [Candidatus Haiyanarchaeum thermophilum]MCW1307194.1 hypothetical protein [Candidatus Haiyanarchaeum thermophilum]